MWLESQDITTLRHVGGWCGPASSRLWASFILTLGRGRWIGSAVRLGCSPPARTAGDLRSSSAPHVQATQHPVTPSCVTDTVRFVTTWSATTSNDFWPIVALPIGTSLVETHAHSVACTIANRTFMPTSILMATRSGLVFHPDPSRSFRLATSDPAPSGRCPRSSACAR